MRRLLGHLGVGTLFLVLVAGCGSGLHHETTMSVAPNELKRLLIDPISHEQKVRVQVSAPGTPVNVYCYLEKDKSDAERAAETGRPSDKILASAKNQEEAVVVFAVPANATGVVLLTRTSGKTATAKVKIDGQ
jgi:hypothetical protein